MSDSKPTQSSEAGRGQPPPPFVAIHREHAWRYALILRDGLADHPTAGHEECIERLVQHLVEVTVAAGFRVTFLPAGKIGLADPLGQYRDPGHAGTAFKMSC